MKLLNRTLILCIYLGFVLGAVYTPAQMSTVVRKFRTTYDTGDSFAAYADRVYVAEDNGGVIDVYRVTGGGVFEIPEGSIIP